MTSLTGIALKTFRAGSRKSKSTPRKMSIKSLLGIKLISVKIELFRLKRLRLWPIVLEFSSWKLLRRIALMLLKGLLLWRRRLKVKLLLLLRYRIRSGWKKYNLGNL
jgi:hypothetical protein